MILTLKGFNIKNTQALYKGAARVIRIMLGTFPNKTAPETIEIPDGIFTPAKVKLTKEERKAKREAARAAKLTGDQPPAL